MRSSNDVTPVLLGAAIAFAIVWVLVVVLSGLGVNVWRVQWDFENTGLLGDSFGIVSAVMTSLAAIFAFRTYRQAKEESKGQRRQSSETTFLNLLERRYQVLEHVSVRWATRYNGEDAVERISRYFVDGNSGKAISELLEEYVQRNESLHGIGTLWRYTYHLVDFSKRNFSDDPLRPISKDDYDYQMVRILRAQMSDSELVLLSVNCAFGVGQKKFKPLVERYALLHNMKPEHVRRLGLEGHFDPSAFGVTPADQAEVLGGS